MPEELGVISWPREGDCQSVLVDETELPQDELSRGFSVRKLVRRVSPEGLRVFGLPPHGQLSMHQLLRMVPEDERHGMMRMLRDVLRTSTVLATDVPVTVIDGRQRIVHVEAEPEFNDSGYCVGYTGIVQDVTDRRAAEDRIRHLANFDALTGLPNRRQLMWRAERSLDAARRSGHQVALLMIDIDHFKTINDTLGHDVGDKAIRFVAEALRSTCRATDLVGRYGGEEFCVLMKDADHAGTVAFDRRLRELLEQGGTRELGLPVNYSAGIAVYGASADTMKSMLKRADDMLYRAKSAGRGRTLSESGPLLQLA